MSFMEMVRLKLHFLMSNQALTYRSTEGEFVLDGIRREEMLAEKKRKIQ
jgi:hypothetical protein